METNDPIKLEKEGEHRVKLLLLITVVFLVALIAIPLIVVDVEPLAWGFGLVIGGALAVWVLRLIRGTANFAGIVALDVALDTAHKSLSEKKEDKNPVETIVPSIIPLVWECQCGTRNATQARTHCKHCGITSPY
jgi:hypothetical protein